MQIFTPSKHNPADDNNTVLVIRDEIKEKKTDGGLYVPERAVELANQGEVRAVVEGSQYKPGDRIVFVKYSGAEIELNGVTYTLLKEKEVQGTVTNTSAPADLSPDDQKKFIQEQLAKLEAEAQDTTRT
jgi:chaperonin GroES